MKTAFIYFLKLFVFPILKLFIQERKGEKNLPKHNNFILASNHISGRDPFFIGIILEDRLKNVRFIGAIKSLKTFLHLKIFYYLSDTITIKIMKKKPINREKFIEKVIKYIEAGEIIVIFPEGDTNRTKVLLKGKTGVAELALKARVPVIPMGIKKEALLLKRSIKIGKPMYFSEEYQLAKKIENNKDEYNLLLRKITDRIMKEISQLCDKSYTERLLLQNK